MRDPSMARLQEREEGAYWRSARKKWPKVAAGDEAIFNRLMRYVKEAPLSQHERLVAERTLRYALAHGRNRCRPATS